MAQQRKGRTKQEQKRSPQTAELEEIERLYDAVGKHPSGYFLDAWAGRITENSVYRRRAIEFLHIAPDSTVLDVACGIGYNFKIIESCLQNGGRLVGVDVSSKSLEAAESRVARHKWTNVELVHVDFNDYEPRFQFDAVLCTLALEIIPDYRRAIEKVFDLLKPQGRFALLGMQLSSKTPYDLLNPLIDWINRKGRIDTRRDIVPCIESRFGTVDYYEDCFMGYYFIVGVCKN